ncbi:MAG: alpha/beta hydrolase [Gammaproteobacteria bacterium]|nr:MAG: alpha/beta hydrolase [Gammaproteobacteria bacterium]
MKLTTKKIPDFSEYGSGKPLLFLGGLLQSKEPLGDFVDQAVIRGYKVIRVGYRGHVCKFGNDFTLDDIISDIKEVISYLQVEKVDIFGEALGGTLALVLAQQIPEKIGRIAIAGAVCFRDRERHQRFKKWYSTLKTEGIDCFIEESLPDIFSSGWLERNSHKVADIKSLLLADRSSDGMIKLFESAARYRMDISRLSSIKVPVMVIGGKHDAIARADHSRRLAKKLPLSKYKELESGHAMTKECSDILIGTIDDFFQNGLKNSNSAFI